APMAIPSARPNATASPKPTSVVAKVNSTWCMIGPHSPISVAPISVGRGSTKGGTAKAQHPASQTTRRPATTSQGIACSSARGLMPGSRPVDLHVAHDVGVGGEPDAGMAGDVADQAFQHLEARAVTGVVRVHGELENSALGIGGVELGAEDLEHARGRRV